MAKSKEICCNQCLGDLTYKDAYKVSRFMHRTAPEMGHYTTYYCEKCISEKHSYDEILKKPKSKKKK